MKNQKLFILLSFTLSQALVSAQAQYSKIPATTKMLGYNYDLADINNKALILKKIKPVSEIVKNQKKDDLLSENLISKSNPAKTCDFAGKNNQHNPVQYFFTPGGPVNVNSKKLTTEQSEVLLAELQKQGNKIQSLFELKADCKKTPLVFDFYNALKAETTDSDLLEFREFLRIATWDQMYVWIDAQDENKRIRPYTSGNPKLNPCGIPQDNKATSYPSGHATNASYITEVLSFIYPELKKSLEDRKKEIMLSRVLVGLHYTSDVEQGEILGKAVFNFLKDKTNVIKKLNSIKPKLKKFLVKCES